MITTKQSGGLPYGRRVLKMKPLPLTALLYLREAILKQQYETCGELIETAKDLGVSDTEIRDLLENPARKFN